MAAERAVGERRSPPFCVCGGRLRASLPAAEAAEPWPGSRRGLSPAGSGGSQLTWPPLACCCLPGQQLTALALGETEKQKLLPVAGAEGKDPKPTDFRQRPPR